MAAPTYLLDANVIVRFLAADHAAHLERAKQLIARAEAGEVELVVMPWVLAETVYVLTSVYDASRKQVAEALETFVGGCRDCHGRPCRCRRCPASFCQDQGGLRRRAACRLCRGAPTIARLIRPRPGSLPRHSAVGTVREIPRTNNDWLGS